MSDGAAIFLGLWLQHPLQIAAVCPSSEKLAAVLGRLANVDRPGIVLELGAGTGSLTAGLLNAGIPRRRLVALECESRLVEVLQRKFPGLETIAGDATQLDRLLDRRGIDRLAVVVSSLPIKWFPLDAQRAVVRACFDRLGRGGRFLQITNAFSSPLRHRELGIVGREAARIWRNLPPAQIWAYRESGGIGRGMP